MTDLIKWFLDRFCHRWTEGDKVVIPQVSQYDSFCQAPTNLCLDAFRLTDHWLPSCWLPFRWKIMVMTAGSKELGIHLIQKIERVSLYNPSVDFVQDQRAKYVHLFKWFTSSRSLTCIALRNRPTKVVQRWEWRRLFGARIFSTWDLSIVAA